MVGKKVKKQRKQAPQAGRTVNANTWRGGWSWQAVRADLWYKAELRRLGIWPPPPERLVFEAAPGI